MLDPARVIKCFRINEVAFFAGVPDSVLGSFCSELTRLDVNEHVICHNEGGAIAIAAGRYFACGQVSVVYMQNSGQGNAINPIASLAAPPVYSIPMLILVGWRGEPGVEDEPQHVAQGAATRVIFESLGVTCIELPKEESRAFETIAVAVRTCRSRSAPVALLARQGIFSPSTTYAINPADDGIDRDEAIRIVLSKMGNDDCAVTSTGEISRQALRSASHRGGTNVQVLPNVGAMGHASQIALGIALFKPDRRVFCLDGDGSALMHLGALATIGKTSPVNLYHFVLNNGAHMSVGGQPTAGFDIDFPALAAACRYRWCGRAHRIEHLREQIDVMSGERGPAFLEIRLSRRVAERLPRPGIPPAELGRLFRGHLGGGVPGELDAVSMESRSKPGTRFRTRVAPGADGKQFD